MKYLQKTRQMLILILSVLVCVASINPYAVAAIEEERILDRYPSVEDEKGLREEKARRYPEYLEPERWEISVFADLQAGYDNNVDLDSERNKDGFMQGSVSAEAAYQLNDYVKLRAGFDQFDVLYFKYNRNNIIDTAPYVGFDWDLIPGFTLRNYTTVDYFCYPTSKEDTFWSIGNETFIRNYVGENIYHELGYEYVLYLYPDQKVFNSGGQKSDNDRKDDRNKIKYNVVMYFDKFIIRLKNEFYYNQSNDKYQDYYDYWVYRVRPSVMIFFTDKLYADLGLVYKDVQYKDRRCTNNIGRKVRDRILILNPSLFYDVTKNISLGASYSYTENFSNDPFEQYSGSVVTAGVYYTF